MHGQSVVLRDGADCLNRRERIDRAASGIVGVFKTDEGALNRVGIFRADGGLHLIGRHQPPGALHPMELQARQCAGGALLVADDVGLSVDDDFTSRLGERAQTELISECA